MMGNLGEGVGQIQDLPLTDRDIASAATCGLTFDGGVVLSEKRYSAISQFFNIISR